LDGFRHRIAPEVIRRFLGALQFLTVLPLRVQTSTPGEAAVFFPVVGVLLGVTAGAMFLIAQRFLSSSIAALLAISGLVAMTGALHEDGLADVADAFRTGRSRERIMTILKDSRIGAYGALALIVSFALRWQSLVGFQVNAALGLAVSLAVSRSALVLLAFLVPSVGGGLGASFASFLSARIVVAVLAQALLCTVFCGWRGAAMLLASGITVLLARSYFMQRLGGVNGDCLGATCQAVETVNLMILAWQHSS
jgi:adenosylcobinamide-GDP ribazoletransferase